MSQEAKGYEGNKGMSKEEAAKRLEKAGGLQALGFGSQLMQPTEGRLEANVAKVGEGTDLTNAAPREEEPGLRERLATFLRKLQPSDKEIDEETCIKASLFDAREILRFLAARPVEAKAEKVDRECLCQFTVVPECPIHGSTRPVEAKAEGGEPTRPADFAIPDTIMERVDRVMRESRLKIREYLAKESANLQPIDQNQIYGVTRPAPADALREAAQIAVDYYFKAHGDYEYLVSEHEEHMEALRSALAALRESAKEGT